MAIPDDVEMDKYLTGDVDLDVDVIEMDDEWKCCVDLWYAGIQLLFVTLLIIWIHLTRILINIVWISKI
jgi:hypothetical protein